MTLQVKQDGDIIPPEMRPRSLHAPATAGGPAPGAVLAKATLRAAARLELTDRQLAAVIGVSPATLSRLRTGRAIDPASKEGELALHFVRLFRSLDALFGGDEAKARAWFHAGNRHLGAAPAALVARVQGLLHVVEYLDAMRAKN